MKPRSNAFGTILLCLIALSAMVSSISFPIGKASASTIKVGSNNTELAKKYRGLKIKCSKIAQSSQSISMPAEKSELAMPCSLMAFDTNPFITNQDTLRKHPAIADDGNGHLVQAYEYYNESSGDTAIYWRSSDDYGANWSPSYYWNITGVETYPSVAYWGSDLTFHGTFVTPPQRLNGGAIYWIEIPNSTVHPWYARYWNYSTWGYHDMKMAAIACDDSQEPWQFGLISLVISRTGSPSYTDEPTIFCLDSLGVDSSLWGHTSDYLMSGCENTSVAIDHVTGKTYAVYDWYNSTNNQWQLFIRADQFGDWDGWSDAANWYFTNPHLHIKSPVVTAHNDTLVIVTECYNDSTANDVDIICWYSYNANLDSLEVSVIVGSDYRENRPAISHAGAGTFLCSYLINDKLMCARSLDGGLNWSDLETEQLSADTQSVVDEYRTAAMSEDGSKILWEYMVEGKDNIYLGSKGFAYRPRILTTSPAQNGLNLPVSSNISVTFDTTMDAMTINDSTFLVNARSTGPHEGIITYNAQTRTAIFDPANDFDEGEVVTVMLVNQIKTSYAARLQSYIWSFTIKTENGSSEFNTSVYSVGDGPHDVFAADFDKDGDLDLVTPNENSDNVSVLLNDGYGTFVLDSTYLVGNSPLCVYPADVDGDDDIDIITANCNSDNVSILLNNGDASFTFSSGYSVGDCPRSVVAADLDGDGDLDLATANWNSSNISVLFNDGQGVFSTPAKTYSVGNNPCSIFSADLDGDGDVDLATANLSSNNVTVLLNNGYGGFGTYSNYPTGNGPISVYGADLDIDGDIDLVTANSLSDNISVLLNSGNATFASPSHYLIGGSPQSVLTADLNGDDYLDLISANANDDNVGILVNDGQCSFVLDSIYQTGDYPVRAFPVDVDGDGDLDIVTANYISDNISVLMDFLRGDANGDGIINVGDIVYLVSYLYRGGPAPVPLPAGDVNCDDIINVGDIVYLVSYLYRGGPPPECP